QFRSPLGVVDRRGFFPLRTWHGCGRARSLSSPGPGCGPDRAGARPANAVGPTTVSRPEKTPNQHRPLSCTPSSSIASSHDQAKQPKDAVLPLQSGPGGPYLHHQHSTTSRIHNLLHRNSHQRSWRTVIRVTNEIPVAQPLSAPLVAAVTVRSHWARACSSSAVRAILASSEERTPP